MNQTTAQSSGLAQVHYSEQKFYENFSVLYTLPLSNHDNGSLMAIASFYALLFILGTCGNAAILAVAYYVKASDSRSKHNTTLIYICVLSIVDFLSMLPLPMTIVDQKHWLSPPTPPESWKGTKYKNTNTILGFWMFGTFACKLFRLLEHIGKIFSTFILVAFSIDRYCAVCHPLQVRIRNPQTVYALLSTMFLFTCVLLFPILLRAHSKELIIHEKFDLEQRTITKMHLYKCVDDLGDTLFVVFTLYCFLLAYLMPLLFMIYFYYGMLLRLFKQARIIQQGITGRGKQYAKKGPTPDVAKENLSKIPWVCTLWS
ncbi:hypothetical protein Y032_0022g608 [Ancylostoma ceylanicum]|uniref:G-protein coupled receptors family 1 profile domain-containing protein n=1 Tax=Ancylostoma ceylanicum TaxID=53326 RepID=A0A016V0Z0_9BILA|nr:hypothetical protein Y032_0022g608 [Ancylostoma ceylanicum]